MVCQHRLDERFRRKVGMDLNIMKHQGRCDIGGAARLVHTHLPVTRSTRGGFNPLSSVSESDRRLWTELADVRTSVEIDRIRDHALEGSNEFTGCFASRIRVGAR